MSSPSTASAAMPTSTWTPQVNGTSAFVGDPPNTQRDWWITAGLLRAIGFVDVDPAEGYFVAALTKDQTPSPYHSKRPAIIGGLITVIVAIVGVTGTRLILRASVSHMRVGADDWATLAAAVGFYFTRANACACARECAFANLRNVFQGMGLAYTICQLIMAINGGGDHIVRLPKPYASLHYLQTNG